MATQSYDDVVGVLSYAAGHELAVHLTTDDGSELTAVPVAVDTGLGALEVVLRLDPDGEEIVVPLARITLVKLV